MMKILSSGGTDPGKKRKNNEDSFLQDDSLGLYAVADGIGGHEEIGRASCRERV